MAGQEMVTGGDRRWLVESKEFEVMIKGGDSGVRIYERSKKKKSSIFIRRDELAWLVGALEEVVEVETSEVFWDQSRAGFPWIITQKCSNRHGRFLTIEEFDGRRRNGTILIPEGRFGQGWAGLIVELDKANSSLRERQEIMGRRDTKDSKEAKVVPVRWRFTDVMGLSSQLKEDQFHAYKEPIAKVPSWLKVASTEKEKAKIEGKMPVTYAQVVECGIRKAPPKSVYLEEEGCKKLKGVMLGEVDVGIETVPAITT